MTNVEQFVEDAIKNNKVVIFTKSTCRKYSMYMDYDTSLWLTCGFTAYCKKAKALLDGYNIKYENVELDTHRK